MSAASDVTQNPKLTQDSSPSGRLLGLLLATLALRLVALGRPLVGNFATKNVVYAMIARNWATGRASLVWPTLDCLGRDGQRALHLLEFPVSAYVSGGLWHLCGGSLEMWGRATAAVFSTAATGLLFSVVCRRYGATAAWVAASAFALAPVSVRVGQNFMLEASLVCFLLAAVECLDRFLETGRWGWLAGLGASLALLWLTKIYALVFLLPLGVAIGRSALRDDGSRSWIRHLAATATLGLALLPAGAWYWHAYANGGPASPVQAHMFYSVRDSAEVHRPPHPLLGKPEFYRDLLRDLAGPVLTPLGLILLAAAFVDRRWRGEAVWLLAAVALILALPRKFHELNYYWMPLLPTLCTLVGLGGAAALDRVRQRQAWAVVLLVAAATICARYSVWPLLQIAPEDRGVVAAGRAIQELTAPTQPVVTIHGTTLDLLYYCDRPGWFLDPQAPGLAARLRECRRQGARYVAVAAAGQGPTVAALAGSVPVRAGEGYAIYLLPD